MKAEKIRRKLTYRKALEIILTFLPMTSDTPDWNGGEKIYTPWEALRQIDGLVKRKLMGEI